MRDVILDKRDMHEELSDCVIGNLAHEKVVVLLLACVRSRDFKSSLAKDLCLSKPAHQIFYLCISRSFLHHSPDHIHLSMGASREHCTSLRLPLSPSDPISTIRRCVLSSRAMDPASFWWALCHGSDYKDRFRLFNVSFALATLRIPLLQSNKHIEHFSFHRGCVMDHSESSSLARLTQRRASTQHYRLC